MTRSLPVGAALGRAIAFVPRAVAGAWGVLLLLAAIMAAPALLPATEQGARLAPLLALAGLVVGLAAEGALYRLGVTAEAAQARRLGLGFAGLQFGRAELRLAGAGVLIALFLAVVVLAAGLVLVFVANAVGLSEPAWPRDLSAASLRVLSWRTALLGGLALAAVWMLVQLSIRLALYKAATVARGRIVSLDALGLSERNFWRLLAGLLIATAPTWALVAWRVWGPSGAASPALVVVQAAVLAFVQAPLGAGFLSEAYRRLEYWGNLGDSR
jgi:hypothetical protein